MKSVLFFTILSNLLYSTNNKETKRLGKILNEDSQADSLKTIVTSSSVNVSLPQNLKTLVSQIESTKYDYPRRNSDIQDMKQSLSNGDFRSVEYKANRIIDKQINLRSLKQKGMLNAK